MPRWRFPVGKNFVSNCRLARHPNDIPSGKVRFDEYWVPIRVAMTMKKDLPVSPSANSTPKSDEWNAAAYFHCNHLNCAEERCEECPNVPSHVLSFLNFPWSTMTMVVAVVVVMAVMNHLVRAGSAISAPCRTSQCRGSTPAPSLPAAAAAAVASMIQQQARAASRLILAQVRSQCRNYHFIHVGRNVHKVFLLCT
mmetsp:Transcript_62771/g.127913  ORF Transcript_62771/g.127913 Transcript_62771/m.127913 type:complete len:196 (+) Transcript_62771:3352-3939(+)